MLVQTVRVDTMISEADQRTPISTTVVEAVAAVEDTDPLDLDQPLFDVVDAEALDAVTASATDVSVEFEYQGHDIVVRSDGTVLVDEATASTEVPSR
jgi:hypothetical protein